MPQNRYYYPAELYKGHDIILKDDEFHYLRNVMRARVDETVEVVNGKGALAQCRVTKMLDKLAHLEITDVQTQDRPSLTLNLALAFLKPAHLEYAIEKGCEVGVSNFMLFAGSRSEKKSISDQYLKRLQTIILSATKQCGRFFLPELLIKDKLSQCLEGLVLFGDLESSTHITKQPLAPVVTLVIGPEAGITEQERKLLIDGGAKGVLLHANTLRAETAAVVGAALINAYSEQDKLRN